MLLINRASLYYDISFNTQFDPVIRNWYKRPIISTSRTMTVSNRILCYI